MSNYNERLDKVLLTYKSAHQIAFNEVDPHGNNMSPYDGSAAVSKRSRDIEAEAKADLTTLIKELVAEAKPSYKTDTRGATQNPNNAFYHTKKAQGYNEAIEDYEQNILKALEEV